MRWAAARMHGASATIINDIDLDGIAYTINREDGKFSGNTVYGG